MRRWCLLVLVLVLAVASGCHRLYGLLELDPIASDAAIHDAIDAQDGGSQPTGLVIAGGTSHTCAIGDGSVRCWGRGELGRLGYGNVDTIGDNESPASAGSVAIGPSTAVALGERHTCALLAAGAVTCWGDGQAGQLGYGNTTVIGDDESPGAAVPLGGTAVEISAGNVHTCARLNTGGVRCWGAGNRGKLGYGNQNDLGKTASETPDMIGDVPLGGAAAQIELGLNHSCALLTDGNVRCWGANVSGQLGLGNTNDLGDLETPDSTTTINIGGLVTQVSAGGAHTCALLTTGAVRCWGEAASGQLGYGNTTTIGDDEAPASAGDVDVGDDVVSIAAGGSHTCALLETGAVRCWGEAASGQLGYGTTNRVGDTGPPSAAGDVPLGGIAVAIAAGTNHTCAILTTGAVRCWGLNVDGQLGYATTANHGDNELPSSREPAQVF